MHFYNSRTQRTHPPENKPKVERMKKAWVLTKK